MKKKLIKFLIGSLLCSLSIFNLNFLSDESFEFFLNFSDIEAMASSSEGGGNVGIYYQIVAACGGEGMNDWMDWCCRGSEVSCIKDYCGNVVRNGCDSFGRLEI